MTRPSPLLRGWSAAVIATLLAAGSHALAGHGHHDAGPSPLVWILTLALAGPVCTTLAGRALSWGRLSVAVVFSQALFHGFYSLGPSTAPSASLLQAAEHAHHGAAPAPVTVASSAAAPVAPDAVAAAPDPSMVLAHLLAAVATVVLLRTGERSVVTALDWVLLRRPVLVLTPAPVPAAHGLRTAESYVQPVLRGVCDLVAGLRWRGPPAVALPR